MEGKRGTGTLRKMNEYNREIVGYMCKTDYECELGAAKGGNVVYPSVEDLEENLNCVKSGSCGIVKVTVVGVEVLREDNYELNDK